MCDLLIFHEYKVEDAVEEGVDEICETEVEDEEIGDSSHPLVPWQHNLILFVTRLRILTNNNPEHRTVTKHCRHDHQDEGHVPEVDHGPGHLVTVNLERTRNCSMEQFSRIRRMAGDVDSPVRDEGGVEADDAGVDQEGPKHLVVGKVVARHLKMLRFKC